MNRASGHLVSRSSKAILTAVLAGVLAAAACLPPPATPNPSPIPPPHLVHRPAQAMIECHELEHMRIRAVLWEHAERAPPDNSGSVGIRGEDLGTVAGCTEVAVLERNPYELTAKPQWENQA
jgi:hypothetical protein